MTNLKKIVIWALVIVNICFLVFFLWRTYSDYLYKKEALNDLSALFELNGIYMNTDNIHEDGRLSELVTIRDLPGEKKLAETLLGPVEESDQGGSIYSYTGDRGQARFGNGGEFEITFTAGVYKDKGGAESTAKQLLQTMRAETSSVDTTGQAGNETVTAVCSWHKKMIYNCRITFVFADGNLIKVSGNHAANIKRAPDETDMSSCATALTRFLNEVKSEKFNCAEIRAVDTGYIRNALGDGLSPAWRIVADTGVYYVNAVTGDIEQDI